MKRNQFVARMFASMSDSNPEVMIRVRRSDGSMYEVPVRNVYFSVKRGENRVILEMPELSELSEKVENEA